MRVAERADVEVWGLDSDWTWGVALHASERMGMGTAVPMTPSRVAAVYVWCSANGYSFAKILDVRDIVSLVHRFGGHADPTTGRFPRNVLREIGPRARGRGRHGSPRQRRAGTRGDAR